MFKLQLVITSGVKSILKLYLSKSIVTDDKTTRSKVESIDQKKHLSKSTRIAFSNVKVSTTHLPMRR